MHGFLAHPTISILFVHDTMGLCHRLLWWIMLLQRFLAVQADANGGIGCPGPKLPDRIMRPCNNGLVEYVTPENQFCVFLEIMSNMKCKNDKGNGD
jgi:hypothetical protein